MEKQFTASEVREVMERMRDCMARHEVPTVDEYTRSWEAMNAFADLLEAQEKALKSRLAENTVLGPGALQKAESIRQTRNSPNGSTWMDVKYEDVWASAVAHPKSFETRILYAHPDPADAERLAEALRELVHACEEHDSMVSRIIGHPAGWNAQYLNTARQALAAHSAQEQPPAASVTDAMVERARLAYAETEEAFPDEFGVGETQDPMRAALEAALAAQENPNG